MIWNVTLQDEPAEPAIGEVLMHLLALPTLRADAEAMADDQHPDHQQRVDRAAGRCHCRKARRCARICPGTEGRSALIIPFVQKRTVLLAPGVTVFAVVAFGILFGSLGVVFATPLTVICMVLVKKLWIRDALDEQTRLPGESPL
jgi:hypothetical protein